MHQQVNEWRPHQTREALISLLQNQLEKTRNETRALQEVTDSVRRTLVGFAGVQFFDSSIDGFDTQPKLNGSDWADNALDRSSHARSGELWKIMDDIFE
ncbi:hypothetical protein CMQ_5846 [Grosmannia clavigera kw1407]|uniref:Mediator of RNA polymerase II transcription subunit 7 n=1 Tax=Grosmannia clavigera (strain kw1407 / UAMH 11150) TaxID=655863 RepID=F0XIC4_GROCL|nr:uncharacterized protein CMQ_5846 [Grosmannia clavigera kw1407]EFX02485.1 hypothetical protein CMQ_5846 [Grosmannia clavigera kw1407]